MTRKALFLAVNLLLATSMAIEAANPTSRCGAQRATEVARFIRCYERAASRALLNGIQADFSSCSSRLASKWAAIDADFGSACPQTATLAEVEALAANAGGLLFSMSAGTAPTPGCGNGLREGSEQCDGGDLGGATCADLGYQAGNLVCTGACKYEVANCRHAADARFVFTTSSTLNGAFGPVFGSIGGADAFCNQRAAAAGLAGVYLALASSDTHPADPAWGEALSRIATFPVPYMLVDGSTVAADGDQFKAGPLNLPVNLDEFGIPINSPRLAWTGTAPGWTLQPPNCLNWTNSNDGQIGLVGDLTSKDIGWIDAQTRTCGQQAQVVCVQVSVGSPALPTCGNGIREGAELCDGSDVTGTTCRDFGYEVGSVLCSAGCKYDLSNCRRTGEARVVFATSTTVNGAFGPKYGSLGGADELCTELAAAAQLSGQFRALASSDANPGDPAWGDAQTRLARYDLPYVLVDGTQIAADGETFRTAPLDRPINRNEMGDPIPAPLVAWTGTSTGWALQTPNCLNWSNFTTQEGTVADLTSATVSWIDSQTLGCAQQARLVCVQM